MADNLPPSFVDRSFFKYKFGLYILVQLREQRRNGIGTITKAEEGLSLPSTPTFKLEGLPLLSEECAAGSFSTEVNAELCEELPQHSIHEGGHSESKKCTNGTAEDENFSKRFNIRTEAVHMNLLHALELVRSPVQMKNYHC